MKQLISGTQFETVLVKSMTKNPDFLSFFDQQSNTMSDLINRKYYPLTSCDVERSFSMYRSILSDRRTNLSPGSLKDRMIIKYNQFL